MGSVADLAAHCFVVSARSGAALICRVHPVARLRATTCYEILDGDGDVAVVRVLLRHHHFCTEAERARITTINLPKGVH